MKQIALLFCLIGLLLAGCRTDTAPGHRDSGASADQTFWRLAEEYLEGHLAARPMTGTSLGLHQYDGKVSDFSAASIARERSRLKRFEKQLRDFPASQLSPGARYDLRLVQTAVANELFSIEAMESFERNPMTYAGALDVNIYLKRDFAPLPERVGSVIKVLDAAPKIFQAARANLRPVLPRPFVETAIEVANGSIRFLETDLVTATRVLSDASLQRELNRAQTNAVGELKRYVTWLQQEKLPRSDQGFALGREKYARMLLGGEMISHTPEEILKIGLQELAREQKIFAETARAIDPTRKPIEVFRELQKEHPKAETLIEETRKNLEAIRQFLVDRNIITPPSEVRVRVEETPAYARATSFASMDTPGPFETRATEAYYYVTPVEKEWPEKQKAEWLTAFNYYTTDVVSIHEAYPGHYFQFLALNNSPATRLEKIFGSYAFSEGWAHYTEQMMLDEGFGGPDRLRKLRYRLAQSDEALLRLCRLCVSIKMHCQGMSLEEGVKFFEENCYYEPKPARQEAIRGTYDPGYLYYTVGKLQILKLREDYRKQEGASFSLQKFHDEMLRHGMPPLRLLREVMLKDRKIWDQTF